MKTIGIIGGMGPEATMLLYKKIISNTPAKCDQEHIPTIIYSNTYIPDRTEAILNGGKNPLASLIDTAVTLEKMGSEILIMPCNTAHFFYESIRSHVNIKFLNMIELTASHVSERYKSGEVALFATSGTIDSGIYTDALLKHSINLIIPKRIQEKAIMDVIYEGVKKGIMDIDTTEYRNVISDMKQQGVKAIILGCTELPVLHEYQQFDEDIAWLDPMTIMADESIMLART